MDKSILKGNLAQRGLGKSNGFFQFPFLFFIFFVCGYKGPNYTILPHVCASHILDMPLVQHGRASLMLSG